MRKPVFLAFLLVAVSAVVMAQEEYPLGPDSNRQPGVPTGVVTHYTWTSRIFPGTTRDYWVYLPAQYSADKPACLMVFQDGEGFIKEDGRERIPIVFDNLIARHDMPVTIGIFINPGVLKASSSDQQDRFNRSFEYDGMSDRYARFLLEEIIPEVAKHYNLSTNPDDRAIAGLSSGGICAFTVAWNRPDAFHRVLSFIGSFTDLRGGDVYPNLIRKTEPKPLRVFLQDGNHDLNIYAGDWWMANQSVASALQFAGYDVKFVTGDKDHDMDQGGAILPDALRWLWRDYPQPIAKPGPPPGGLQNAAILDPASDWRLAATFPPERVSSSKSSFVFPVAIHAGLAVAADGEIAFADQADRRIVKVADDGTTTEFISHAPLSLLNSRSMAFGPGASLYSCERDHIVVYPPHGKRRVIAQAPQCLDIAVTHDGGVYFTSSTGFTISYVDSAGRKEVAYSALQQLRSSRSAAASYAMGIIGWGDWARYSTGMVDWGDWAGSGEKPSELMLRAVGIRLSPDQSLLFADDPGSRWVWSFHTAPDGLLSNGEPFYRLEAPDDSSYTGAAGMTVDTLGYLYVATRLGIQVCDQPGRVVAIIDPPPTEGRVEGLAFAGPDFQNLYATEGRKFYKHHLLRKGVTPGPPVKPPVPHL